MRKKKKNDFLEDDEEKDYEVEDPEKSDILVHERYVRQKKIKKWK